MFHDPVEQLCLGTPYSEDCLKNKNKNWDKENPNNLTKVNKGRKITQEIIINRKQRIKC